MESLHRQTTDSKTKWNKWVVPGINGRELVGWKVVWTARMTINFWSQVGESGIRVCSDEPLGNHWRLFGSPATVMCKSSIVNWIARVWRFFLLASDSRRPAFISFIGVESKQKTKLTLRGEDFFLFSLRARKSEEKSPSTLPWRTPYRARLFLSSPLVTAIEASGSEWSRLKPSNWAIRFPCAAILHVDASERILWRKPSGASLHPRLNSEKIA